MAETAEQWIKNLEPHVNGRRDMLALREHYSGEGNSSQNTTSLTRFQPRHLEHQGFGAVGAAIIIVTLRRKGERKPQDRFSRGITLTGWNYQKKISSAC